MESVRACVERNHVKKFAAQVERKGAPAEQGS